MLISLTLPFKGLGGSFLRAQGNDPVLAGMILAYTNKAEKELKQQEQMMLLESTGHLWIKEEVQGVTDLQRSSTLIWITFIASSVMRHRYMDSIMK